MPFSSSIFLGLFLPLALLVQNCSRAFAIRFYFLLFLSFIFYWWAEPIYYLPMVLCLLSSYLCGLGIDRTRLRKVFLFLGIAFNLSQLIWLKYSFFLYQQFLSLLQLGNIHFHSEVFIEHRLPLGVSFFTFHSLSYLIDIYRREIKSASRFGMICQYFLFFPHQIAGPIVRYKQFLPQAETFTATAAMKTEGIRRFIFGLAKKILLADTFAFASDRVFGLAPLDLSTPLAWIGTLAYSFQIYFDFSGYSDMAIGLALCFGIRFDENFLYPYRSTSITDFWRRWHVSLSKWFRDYLYVPLGGNRKSPLRTYLNLLIVFIVCGAWHGANWTFIVWGLWHGGFLILERKFPSPFSNRRLSMVVTFFIVAMGWVVFRSPNLEHALAIYKSLFTWTRESGASQFFTSFLIENPSLWLAFFFAPWVSGPKPFKFLERHSRLGSVVVFLLLIVSLAKVANETFSPFIYFRF